MKNAIFCFLILIIGLGLCVAQKYETKDSFWINITSAETSKDAQGKMMLVLEWNLFWKQYDRKNKSYESDWGLWMEPVKPEFIFIPQVALDSSFTVIVLEKEMKKSPYYSVSDKFRWGCIFTGLYWESDYYWRVIFEYRNAPYKSDFAEGLYIKHKAILPDSDFKTVVKFIKFGRSEILLFIFLAELLFFLFFILSLIKRKVFLGSIIIISIFMLFLGCFGAVLDMSIIFRNAYFKIVSEPNFSFSQVAICITSGMYRAMVGCVIAFLFCAVNTLLFGLALFLCRKHKHLS